MSDGIASQVEFGASVVSHPAFKQAQENLTKEFATLLGNALVNMGERANTDISWFSDYRKVTEKGSSR